MNFNPYDLSLLQAPVGGYKQPKPQQPQEPQQPKPQQYQSKPVSQMLDNTYDFVPESDWLKIPLNTYIRWQYKNKEGYDPGGLVIDTMITKDNHKKIKIRIVNTKYFKMLDTADIQSIYRKQSKYSSKKIITSEPVVQDPDQEIQTLNQIIQDKDRIINEKEKTISELLKLIENITKKLTNPKSF